VHPGFILGVGGALAPVAPPLDTGLETSDIEILSGTEGGEE